MKKTRYFAFLKHDTVILKAPSNAIPENCSTAISFKSYKIVAWDEDMLFETRVACANTEVLTSLE